MAKIETDDLLSVTQAAILRGTTQSAVSQLIRKNRLPVIKIAGKPFVSRKDAERFIPLPTGPKPRKAQPVRT